MEKPFLHKIFLISPHEVIVLALYNTALNWLVRLIDYARLNFSDYIPVLQLLFPKISIFVGDHCFSLLKENLQLIYIS